MSAANQTKAYIYIGRNGGRERCLEVDGATILTIAAKHAAKRPYQVRVVLRLGEYGGWVWYRDPKY